MCKQSGIILFESKKQAESHQRGELSACFNFFAEVSCSEMNSHLILIYLIFGRFPITG